MRAPRCLQAWAWPALLGLAFVLINHEAEAKSTLPNSRQPHKPKLYFVCKEGEGCFAWPVRRGRNEQTRFSNNAQCGVARLKRNSSQAFHTETIVSAQKALGFLCKTIGYLGINKSRRLRRQATKKGKFKGQTQSQYLNIGGHDNGKAEAVSDADSSRALVSGKSGMGQAQSQSVYDPTCDECLGQNIDRPEGLSHKGVPEGSSYINRHPQGKAPAGTGSEGQESPSYLHINQPGTGSTAYRNDGQPLNTFSNPGQTFSNSQVPNGATQSGFNYDSPMQPHPNSGTQTGFNYDSPMQPHPNGATQTGFNYDSPMQPHPNVATQTGFNYDSPMQPHPIGATQTGFNYDSPMQPQISNLPNGQQQWPKDQDSPGQRGSNPTYLNKSADGSQIQPTLGQATPQNPQQNSPNGFYQYPGQNYYNVGNKLPSQNFPVTPGQIYNQNIPDNSRKFLGNMPTDSSGRYSPSYKTNTGNTGIPPFPGQSNRLPVGNGENINPTVNQLQPNIFSNGQTTPGSGDVGRNRQQPYGSPATTFIGPNGETYICCTLHPNGYTPLHPSLRPYDGTNGQGQQSQIGTQTGYAQNFNAQSSPFDTTRLGQNRPDIAASQGSVYYSGDPKGVSVPGTNYQYNGPFGTRESPTPSGFGNGQNIPSISSDGRDKPQDNLPGVSSSPGSSYYPYVGGRHSGGPYNNGVQNQNNPFATIGGLATNSGSLPRPRQEGIFPLPGITYDARGQIPPPRALQGEANYNSPESANTPYTGSSFANPNFSQGQNQHSPPAGHSSPSSPYDKRQEYQNPNFDSGSQYPASYNHNQGMPYAATSGQGTSLINPSFTSGQGPKGGSGHDFAPTQVSGESTPQTGFPSQGGIFTPESQSQQSFGPGTMIQEPSKNTLGQGRGGFNTDSSDRLAGQRQDSEDYSGHYSNVPQYQGGGPSQIPYNQQVPNQGQYNQQHGSGQNQPTPGQLSGNREQEANQYSSGRYPSNQYFPKETLTYSNGQDKQSLPTGSSGEARTRPYPGSGSTGMQYTPGVNPTQYDNSGFQAGNVPGIVTDDGASTPGSTQNVDPNLIISDKDQSEAQASIKQDVNGTMAIASSKGGSEKGNANIQVQGTYTGSGSFSAQAHITDEDKGAESQVSGGKEGAISTATGHGKKTKSQATVQLGSETGALQTQSQSDGKLHSTNSQVQGGVKGGMADAQARGPGSTSSQAQIGFTPYNEGDKEHDSLKTPFVGGGSASAQSSGRSGHSQSQLQGKFKYGISYNGAAQAGSSVDKDAILENQMTFKKIDVFKGEKNIEVESEKPLPVPILDANLPENNTQTDRNGEIDHPHSVHHKSEEQPLATTPNEGMRSFDPNGNKDKDYEYSLNREEGNPEEYDGEGVDPPEYYDEFPRKPDVPVQSKNTPNRRNIDVQQTTRGNTQHILLGNLEGQNAEIVQKSSDTESEYKKIYQPGERVPGTNGYVIPAGFTGSVQAISSKDRTIALGSKDSPSQAQTVSLTPGTGKVKYINSKTKNHGKNVDSKQLKSLNNDKPDSNRYMTVTKSVTGALDEENKIKKEYSHTYYTKSSSCGYFTFTCTMVRGTNGTKKVCKPKIPTNPDGTPIEC